ncbi:MAG: hypothetical protein IV100_05420 [Myxococcales bacterium]|nr:hypothetical protein [Myxococcales bacterium]
MKRVLLVLAAAACGETASVADVTTDPNSHGPLATTVLGPLGSVRSTATPTQRATFERGQAVAMRRFDRTSGLGPTFNITFCGACHEKPTLGGGAGLYRNFFLGGTALPDGSFIPLESGGRAGGVVRMYHYGDGAARPMVPAGVNVLAQRNPIPFFGVGLIAALPEEAILAGADPDDLDGDGISGRPNFDRGFVGRFGVKAQTVSIEGFIRGPLMNHLGVTSNPLDQQQKAELPVDSSNAGVATRSAALSSRYATQEGAQAAAPDEPVLDLDDAPDPELASPDLFDLVSFAMLLAGPLPEALDDVSGRGRRHFDAIGCGGCHTPRLVGPDGPLPLYSDLLLHDMGPALADGIRQGVATGSEFRTQPLWGLAAVGPYLHDGRASTIDAAIEAHGGEADAARLDFLELTPTERDELREFLLSLGGRDQASLGLLGPDAPVPAPGDWGGPLPGLTGDELTAFEEGRRAFDRDMGFAEGAGAPRLNGDSCRACHFDPVIGGAGPRDVNVMRHGVRLEDGRVVAPSVGSVLHKLTALHGVSPVSAEAVADVFEMRQTPHLFGLGLIASIPDTALEALADPADTITPDGISGRLSWTDGGRIGRFGWKAQVPTIDEFVRDALTTEIGLTVPFEPGHTFGRIHDSDGVADPEVDDGLLAALRDYLHLLGAPPRSFSGLDAAAVLAGEAHFETAGCGACHVPTLPGADQDVPLYSDLLLHEILPPERAGVEEGTASPTELRTPPLWGLARSGPYLHDGAADNIEASILAHEGEAVESRQRFEALSAAERAALLDFLGSL